MSAGSSHTNASNQKLPLSTSLRRLKGRLLLLVLLTLIIWVVFPILPEKSGLQFGLAYRAFFTVMLLLALLFFWFLGKERIPCPSRPAGVVASLVAVYLITIGSLILAGVVYPQFQRPEPPKAAAQIATERGKELFWSSSVGCFRCHSINGTGGTRGPDLTKVWSRAGERIPGLTPEQYLQEKIAAGATYRFTVPEFAPIMPPFRLLIKEAQIKDLVAYLLSLESEGGNR